MTKKRGKPPYEPNEDHRKTIRIMAAGGIPADKIALAIGIGKTTLYEHYKKEIQNSALEANAAVVASLFNQAKKGNVTAAIFWLKTRMRWTEHAQQDADENKNLQRFTVEIVPKSDRNDV